MSKVTTGSKSKVLSYSECHACDVASLAVSSLCRLNLPEDVKRQLMKVSEQLDILAFSRGGYSVEFKQFSNGDIDYSVSAPSSSDVSVIDEAV